MTQDTHTASGTAIDRALDSFERRERGIPQARIAAELVAELRAALASAAAPAQQPGTAYAATPDGEPSNVELRGIWHGAGGSFHGPNVETGTMPEHKLLPFLRSLIAQAAPAAVAGLSEAVKFTDQSTADPVEKARRYLTAMGSNHLHSLYFFDDGYPKQESATDALATLAVLEQLAAVPTTQPAPQQEAPAMPSGWVSCTIEFDGSGPEEVAYGPKIMMDRLAKWLGKHFERTIAEKAAPQPSPASQDAARLDWLDADESRCVFHLGKSWYTRDNFGMPYRKRASLREAIDAARAAQEGKSHDN